MCGIFGKFSFKGENPISLPVIQKQNDALKHRGPDGEGFLLFSNNFSNLKLIPDSLHSLSSPPFPVQAVMAHRRLAIIDLEDGAQPMCDQDQKIWIVFNGEIYNHIEIRRELESTYTFKTSHSDTEVILNAWKAWGPKMLDRFNGMFGIALIDLNQKQLFLARDRLGIKPLYYSWTSNSFSFASELKALTLDPDFNKNIDPEALSHYLAYGYVPSPFSIFQNSQKLSPGHSLLIDLSNPPSTYLPKAWWKLQPQNQDLKDMPTALEEFNHLMKQSIARRCRSDVDFGAFLSAGLDSSTVVHYMKGHLQQPPKTYTIGIKDSPMNEAQLAAELAQAWKTNHQEYYINPPTLDHLSELIYQMDEPYADYSTLPTYSVCKMVSQDIKMVLSGDGGDELFAGYNSYPSQLKMLELDSKLKGQGLKFLLQCMRPVIPRGIRGRGYIDMFTKPFPNRPEEMMGFFSHDLQQKYHFKTSGFSDLLSSQMQSISNFDSLTQLQYLDFNNYLPDDILTKVDRMSMACSLEVRVPLLDHEIVEWSMRLHRSLLRDTQHGKKILRDLMQPHLPHEYLQRPKTGFSIPLKHWLAHDLKPQLHSALSSKGSFVQQYLPQKLIQSLLNSNGKPLHNPALKLWNLYSLELWAQSYLKSD